MTKELENNAFKGNQSIEEALGDHVWYREGEIWFCMKYYKLAVEYYRKGAEAGDDESMNRLAVCYAKGKGVEQNDQEAVKWYKIAAEAENADAIYNLGVCYEKNRGVAQDLEEAVRLYQQAANLDSKEAALKLANCYEHGVGVERNPEEAQIWRQKTQSLPDADPNDLLMAPTDEQ